MDAAVSICIGFSSLMVGLAAYLFTRWQQRLAVVREVESRIIFPVNTVIYTIGMHQHGFQFMGPHDENRHWEEKVREKLVRTRNKLVNVLNAIKTLKPYFRYGRQPLSYLTAMEEILYRWHTNWDIDRQWMVDVPEVELRKIWNNFNSFRDSLNIYKKPLI